MEQRDFIDVAIMSEEEFMDIQMKCSEHGLDMKYWKVESQGRTIWDVMIFFKGQKEKRLVDRMLGFDDRYYRKRYKEYLNK